MTFPLEASDLSSLGFDSAQISKLEQMILRHIDEGRYPGAQFALARHGKLAAFKSYGNARTEPAPVPTGPDTLFLLFSNTKVLVSSAVWLLVEEGIISLNDPVAEYMPAFAANGKESVTVQHVMTHQGGFPNSNITRAAWADHALMREQVCGFELEWPPGSQLHYRPRAPRRSARAQSPAWFERRSPPARRPWPAAAHLGPMAPADRADSRSAGWPGRWRPTD